MTVVKRTFFLPAVCLILASGSFFLVVADEQSDSSQALLKSKVLKTRKTQIVGYPYAYYTPETNLAIGVGGIMTFYTSPDLILRPSKVTLSGYYSIIDQYKITLGNQFYFARNKTFLAVNFNYGQYVEKFWGVGNNTPEIDNENYTSRGWGFDVDFEIVPILDLFKVHKSGLLYDYFNTRITDKKDNPFLTSGNTLGSEGGVSSGLGFIMVKDSRDNIFFPNQGIFSRFKMIFYMDDIGSDFNFNYYEVDARRYIAIKPDKVIAFQFYGNFVTGTPPFHELPALGGSQLMRGYYKGRYRDRNYMVAQTEYRAFFWRRFGFAAFIGAGNVADELSGFQMKYMKISWGGGLRFKFNAQEKVNLRVDYGAGRDTNGIYFGLEEAF